MGKTSQQPWVGSPKGDRNPDKSGWHRGRKKILIQTYFRGVGENQAKVGSGSGMSKSKLRLVGTSRGDSRNQVKLGLSYCNFCQIWENKVKFSSEKLSIVCLGTQQLRLNSGKIGDTEWPKK